MVKQQWARMNSCQINVAVIRHSHTSLQLFGGLRGIFKILSFYLLIFFLFRPKYQYPIFCCTFCFTSDFGISLLLLRFLLCFVQDGSQIISIEMCFRSQSVM